MFFDPISVLAQAPEDYSQVVAIFTGLLSLLLPVLISLGLFLFVWGGILFLFAQGSEESVRIAKKRMFWGFIILFVMVSFWGIVNFFVTDIFGDGTFVIPFLPEN